jgi:predicted ATPase
VLILRPIPALISGDSDQETLEPNPQVTNFGAWFSGLLADAPACYSRIERYLREVIPDFQDIKNPIIAKDSRSLSVQFSNEKGDLSLPLLDLSDGEKCYLICAMVLASSGAYSPLLCFWDEPDNYLALSEVGHFIIALRKAFQERGGQLIATSQNEEAIRRFSRENTLLLQRRSHLEPTTIRPLSELQLDGDLIGTLIRGDLEP